MYSALFCYSVKRCSKLEIHHKFPDTKAFQKGKNTETFIQMPYYTTLPFSLVLFFSSLENHVIHHSPMKGQQESPASLKTFHSNQIFYATVVNAPLILGFSRQKLPVSKRVHQDFPPQEQGSSLLFCFTYFAEIFRFI